MIDFFEELNNFKPVAEPNDYSEDDPVEIRDLADVLYEITKQLKNNI